MTNTPAIAAATEIKPGRYPDLSNAQLYFQVIGQFLSDWNVKPGDIDGVLAAPLDMATPSPKIFTHEMLAEELGLTPRLGLTMSAGGATYGYMVQYAALAVAAGKADAVLCVGAGKFPKMSPEMAETLIKSVADPEFEFPYGPVIPGLYAQYASRYMHEFGVTPEDMAAVSVSSRKWAKLNPAALTYSKPEITIADVLASRMIASPFHYLDCSIPCEGGGAVLVTSGEIARRISPQPAYIMGMGEFHGHGYVSRNPNLADCGAARAGADAFRQAGVTPSEIDHAQIYDAFSINPLMFLEDLGFAARGKAAGLFHSGRTAPGGDFAVNTYGGLISYGHGGDASGMSMIVEGALQIMGRTNRRQVHAERALVHSYGGMMAEHSTLILGRNI
ncbi:thiolase family protein [Thalassospira sp. TSL5-1]|uniref:thiolase family protein n=1 Tax=Thalassospira sp. TSL5-1 TaxID=1544451 RepID=UPI00093986D9|nr:thiolase family protein [Thalassospira sp. TSL5-1]OKH86649.1 thiolase [Thalassospira sp. TSL5-1]